MAIHTRYANGMGASTLNGSTITNTGMRAEDHGGYNQDFVATDGVIQEGDLRVTQNGTPNMSVNVASGTVYIPNTSFAWNSTSQNKFWTAVNDATVNVPINSNAAGNPRITSIFAKFDTGVTPDDNATNTTTITAVDGTAAPSPSAPATPSNCTRLADITVPNGATSITDGQIVDRRKKAMLINLATPEGFLQNGRISVTVASDNITVSILTLDGSTPSPLNPVVIRIGNINRVITSALSVTKNAGTNWFNAGSSELAAHEIDYFAYLAWDSSNAAVRIGFARIPYARIYSDFSATATDERHGAFSTAPGGNDSVYVVGRFAATLSAGPSYTWSIPSYTNVNLIQRPIYSTRDLNYSPVYTGFSVAPTNVVSTYRIVDNYVDLFYRAGQPGTSNATNLQISLPFSVITLMSYSIRHYSRGTDNGSTVVSDVTYTISSGGTVLSAQLGGNSNGWANANGKKLDWADAMYRIA